MSTPDLRNPAVTEERKFLRSVHDVVIRRDDTGRVSVNVPHQIVHHSPDGFEYGYGGSGPADLALNILAAFIPASEAFRLHQQFKCQAIARLDQDVREHTIDGESIRRWIEKQWSAGD